VWTINLIRTDNPDWRDLAEEWYRSMSKQEIDNWLERTAEK
jgi:hypothetical protein